MLSRALQRPQTPRKRLTQMAAHLTNGTNGAPSGQYTLRDLPKSNVFTSNLPPDPAFSTPEKSHDAPRQTLGPRLVKNALYTFVRPEPTKDPELLAVSPAALRDLNLKPEVENDPDFLATVSGNKIISWDPDNDQGIYPWAQCYGGYQFGQWAGQLGDGRAISLFEAKPFPDKDVRYELQLKGAGKTPYSRFADGKAVLRSSIREFVVSEHLNALSIPSTRALSLVLCPKARVVRERIEPGAIVCRFAQSWIRIGTFDLPRSRGDRKVLRQLSTYVAEHVFPGWESLPGAFDKSNPLEVPRGIPKDEIIGEGKDAQNRFSRLYREVCRRNARTVAAWQAYGFMNGVLNTDNTSIFGLSIDFGPFAFMDAFDPTYTPNHDDHMLRYSYRNQPTIIWWNLVRLGEALGELIGAGAKCDEEHFVEQGVRKEDAKELVERAENLIEKAGEEFKAVFMAEYKQLMTKRFGLKEFKETDFDELYSEWLDTLEAHQMDFHHSFRRLGSVKLDETDTEEKRKDVAGRFFHHLGVHGDEDKARERIAKWLEKWRARVLEDWGEGKDDERAEAMRKVNPNFVARSWILDELIQRVEHQGERDILKNVMKLALNPFEEEWGWNKQEEERFCGDVPKYRGQMQCSCSS